MRTFAIRVFPYPRFYFSYLDKQFLKPVTCVEPSPGLSGNVMQMISLASKNSGASLTSKWRLLYVSRVTRFRYTRRFAGTRHPRITRVACIFEELSYSFPTFKIMVYGIDTDKYESNSTTLNTDSQYRYQILYKFLQRFENNTVAWTRTLSVLCIHVIHVAHRTSGNRILTYLNI
jgi:hypothetical protein